MGTEAFVELLIRPARPVRSFEVARMPALQITRDRVAVAMPRTYRLRLDGPGAPPPTAQHPAPPLDAAARAWLAGNLRKARALYERALRRHAHDWVARFQLAWLAAAFGRLDVQAVSALEREDLTAAGRDRLRALAAADRRPPLSGDEVVWDIDILRTRPASADGAWWAERGHEVWCAGLYGVAAACASEAMLRSPELREAPPAWMGEAAAHAIEHLRRIASALP